MEWLPIIILVVLVLGMTALNDRSAERAGRDRVAEQERILAAMVEMTISSHRNMSGIYAPDAGSGQRPAATSTKTLFEDGYFDGPVEFDITDPTDAFIQPTRSDAIMTGGADNPFGIPGLAYPVASNGEG
jgi:hypothetical protein